MLWQDWVLTLGSVILVTALFPSVFSKHKPALSTSLLTGSVLMTFAVVYFTLNLIFGSIITLFSASTWYVLAIQRFLMKN
jgi:hypothetical protein